MAGPAQKAGCATACGQILLDCWFNSNTLSSDRNQTDRVRMLIFHERRHPENHEGRIPLWRTPQSYSFRINTPIDHPFFFPAVVSKSTELGLRGSEGLRERLSCTQDSIGIRAESKIGGRRWMHGIDMLAFLCPFLDSRRLLRSRPGPESNR